MTILTQSLELTLDTDLSRDDLRLEFYRGLPLNVRCFVRHGATAASLTGVQSATLMLRTSREDTETAALMSDTVDGDDLSDCTLVQWTAGTHEHVTFGFTGAETNLVVTGKKRTLWLVAKAMLDDGREVVIGTGQAVCFESNAIPAGTVAENADPAISVAVGDARYAPLNHEHEIEVTDVNGLTGLLAAKAALTDLVNGLLTKADATETAAAINAILTSLQTKSNASSVTAALALKADLVNGLIPTSQLPVLRLLESLGAAANETQMLALRGDFGSLCLRTDSGIFYAINGSGNGSQLSHWTALGGADPGSGIQTINGQEGPIVVLGNADVGLGNVANVDTRSRANHTGTQPQSSIVNLAQDLAAKASRVNGLVPVSELGGARAKVAVLELRGHNNPGQDAVPEVPADGPFPPPPLNISWENLSGSEQTLALNINTNTVLVIFSENSPSSGSNLWVDINSMNLAADLCDQLNTYYAGSIATVAHSSGVTIDLGLNGMGSQYFLGYNSMTSGAFSVSGGGVGVDYNPGSAAVDAIPASGGITSVEVPVLAGRPISIVSARLVNGSGEEAEAIGSSCYIVSGVTGNRDDDTVLFTGSVSGSSVTTMTRLRAALAQPQYGVRLVFANHIGYSPNRLVLCEIHYFEF